MSRALPSFSCASLAVAILAGAAQAQTALSSAFSRTSSVTAQRGTPGSPSLTLSGGVATGDNGFGAGPALAASLNWNWRLRGMPFNLRVDPHFSYHSRDRGPDANIWFLGGTGNLELPFEISGTSTEPYLFGGGGFYYRKLNVDGPGDSEFSDAAFKGALGFGGGVRFSGLTLEAKVQDVDRFTNVSFLVGFRLGGY